MTDSDATRPGTPSADPQATQRDAHRAQIREGDAEAMLEEARRVLSIESAALERVAAGLASDFVAAVELIHERVAEGRGRVVVSGIGKSGIVGRKIAGTLTSTGTPAVFLHPVEGLHGDLGILGEDDVGILLSKSGATEEMRGLIEYLGRLGVPYVALTGDPHSELARHARVTVDCSVAEEACPMDLAPTSSTAATMAVGDALAVVLLLRGGFREEDFARLHPGGSLGRRLSVLVEDVMVGDDYPTVFETVAMRSLIVPLAHMRGTVPVVDGEGALVGVVTTGDLARLMERDADFLDVSVSDVMTRDPKVVRRGELASAAAHVMEEYGVMALPVVDGDHRLQGVVHLHDLMRARVV